MYRENTQRLTAVILGCNYGIRVSQTTLDLKSFRSLLTIYNTKANSYSFILYIKWYAIELESEGIL